MRSGPFWFQLLQQYEVVPMMAEALGLTSAILAIVEFAFGTSKILHEQVSSLRSHVETVSNLQSDLGTLTTMLGALRAQLKAGSTVQGSERRLEPIKAPLLETGKACRELAILLDSCTVGNTSAREVVKKWLKMQYKGKSIDETRTLLASYKSTLAFSLEIVNLQDGQQTQKSLDDLQDRVEGLKDDIEMKLDHIRDSLDDSKAERQHQLERDCKALNDVLRFCEQAVHIAKQTRPLPSVTLDNNTTTGLARQFIGADEYDGTYNLSASHSQASDAALQVVGLFSPDSIKAMSESAPLATAHILKVGLQTTSELHKRSTAAATPEATARWATIQSAEDSEVLRAEFSSPQRDKSSKGARHSTSDM